MFYIKYRPQKFSEISRPNDTAVALMNQVKKNKTGHAYLFVGSRGTGKTTAARVLAKALNCTKISKSGDPCSKCDNCKNVQTGTFLDLIEIDAASNRGIDDIRELRDKIKLAPSVSKTKVYIIDEVHMLTKEAFNALLKTLEEPPKHAVFILCTTELHKIPATIKSRCQVFKFKRATKAQLVKKLQEICDAEGAKNLTKEDLEKIADASFGGFRDAETILQQVIDGNLDPQSFVGLSSQQIYIDFVGNILDSDFKSAIKQINKLVEDGLDLNVWVLDLLNYFRDLLFISADAHEGLVDVTGENLKTMQKQAEKTSPDKIVQIIDVFMEAGSKIDESVIPHLPLELAVMRVTDDVSGNQSSSAHGGTEPNVGRSSINSANPSKNSSESQKENFDKTKSNEKNNLKALKAIDKKWSKILEGAVHHNNSIHALLKSCKPIEVKGNNVILEVGYAFHKERLESPKNRKIVEGIINDISKQDVGIKCRLVKRPKTKSKKEKDKLTDRNVSVPAFSGDTLTEIFDGSLPL